MYNNNKLKRHNGLHYLRIGWGLIRQSGLRRYAIIPFLINMFLFSGAFVWLYTRLTDWIPYLLAYLPTWLHWLDYLLWPMAIVLILCVFGYFFSTLANWVAAPFCGLLAERVEAHLTGLPAPNTGWLDLLQDSPRILCREWQKFVYYLPRAGLLLLLWFIPGLGQTLAPVAWFLFSAWMSTIQYCDYPFDNHKITFKQMRSRLHDKKYLSLQFGALVSFLTLIPLLNVIIIPVAVCGATAIWVDHFRPSADQQK